MSRAYAEAVGSVTALLDDLFALRSALAANNPGTYWRRLLFDCLIAAFAVCARSVGLCQGLFGCRSVVSLK